MSVKALSWAFNESQAKGADRLVLLALADTMNDEGECWPGVKWVADKAKVSESTARRCLRNLEDMGEIITVESGGSEAAQRAGYRKLRGDRNTNAYLLAAVINKSDGVSG